MTPERNLIPTTLMNSRLEEMTAHEKVVESLRALDLTSREVARICTYELNYTQFETRKLLSEMGLILTSGDLRSDDPVVQVKIEKLREWRSFRARLEGVPAYRVFSNRVLLAMAQKSPRTLEELKALKGIGEKTAGAYGNELMGLLQ